MIKKLNQLRRKVSGSSAGNFKEVLCKLMDECEIDALQLEQHTGIPASTINRFRSDKNSNPTIASLKPIADFFCVSTSQLIGEEPIDESRVSGTFKASKKLRDVPILSLEETIHWPNNIEAIRNNDENKWISIDNQISDEAFAIIMQGDFMEPRIPSGALLILDPQTEIENRDCVLIHLKGQKLPVFRQIFIDGSNSYVKCINPEFKEVKKLVEGEYKILGVMAQIRLDFKGVEIEQMQKFYDRYS